MHARTRTNPSFRLPILALVGCLLTSVAASDDARRVVERPDDKGPRTVPERYESRILRDLRGGSAVRPGAGTDGAVDGVPFTDLASAEIALDGALPTTGGLDRDPVVLGGEGGAVCVLALEDFALRSLRSTDGGLTFDPEVDVTGGPGAGAVLAFAADLAGDEVHAALIVADPAGDRGLRYVRSPDRCLSWDPPVDLVGDGDPAHGVGRVRIAGGSAGFASIAFLGRDGETPYAVATADAGATWTAPVRLDPGNGGSFVPTPVVDVDVDPASDAIFVAYDQDRGSGSQIWTTRSTDGGTTFAAEIDLDAVTPFKGDSETPAVQVVEGGELLVAYWDIASGARVFVAQSKDQGSSFTSSYEEGVGADVARGEPTFCHVPGETTLHLFWLIGDALWHSRSTNNGDAFDEGSTLSVTADADPDGWRPPARIGCAKTGNRSWIVGTSDFIDDTYAGTRTDIYVHRSTDNAVTWLPAERADTDAAAGAASAFGGLVHTVDGDVFVAWSDRRGGAGREENLYGNIYDAGVGFGVADARLDADATSASAAVLSDPVVASDGASGMYVAFAGRGDGHEHDIWVARSVDGGYTFDPAVRVSTAPGGERVQFLPYLAATPDGNVYLAYLSDTTPLGTRELRFNRSTDFGATWQPADQVLGSFSHPVGYFLESFDFPNVQLSAVDGGLVYVAWSDNATVFLARSEDAGATFAIDDVDQDTRGNNRHPGLCAQGDQVVLAITSPDVAFANFSVWGTVSDDRGATWTPLTQLRSESTPERGIFPSVSCDGASGALVVWGDLRNLSTFQLFANRWDGNAWQGDVPVDGPAGQDHFWPAITRAGSDVIVAFENFEGAVYAARSQDGGATFPTHVRLDDAAPDPDAFSDAPKATADGDDVWVFWRDDSAGEPSVAVRWSRNGGATWSGVRRVDRGAPGGAVPNAYSRTNASPAALQDAAAQAWGGDRGDVGGDALVNVADLDDGDRDRFGAASDCDDTDPTAWGVPTTVVGVVLARVEGGVRLSWNDLSEASGSGTVHDLVTGSLGDLRSTGSFGTATCLAADLTDPTYDDLRPAPAPGSGEYYLVRARNGCGDGSYGDSSLAVDPRDDLDVSGPCP